MTNDQSSITGIEYKLKKVLTVLLMLFAPLCVLHAAVGDNYLLWMIEDPMITETNGSQIHVADLVGRGGEASGKTVNGVRVKIEGTDTYLNLGDEWGIWGDVIELPGFEVDADGNWAKIWQAGPTFADISGYTQTGGDASISFLLELGNYDYDGGGDWIVLAVSQSGTLGELRNNGHIFANVNDMHTIVPWQTTFSVPEPCSGLLLLIGGGLLALRRKRLS